MAEGSGAGTPNEAYATSEWPPALNLEWLAQHEPVAPEEIMEGVPCGYATMVAGHGGAGKSQIEFMRAVCIAAGIPFCGLKVARRKVLFVSCEDRRDILHWRLARICAYLSVKIEQLDGWLQILDLVGRDSILFSPDPRTGHALTAGYGVLAERMAAYKTDILVLDGIVDVFGGNENARVEVKQFVNSLLALISPYTGAVILIGHVNKISAANAANGDGYSGSTAWHNSARARWYLFAEAARDEDGEGSERPGKLTLELQKSNHGKAGLQIEFEWDSDAHLLLPKSRDSSAHFDRIHLERTERLGILAALNACARNAPQIVVPGAMTGQRTALHVLSQRPEFPPSLRAGKAAKRRFWRHIEAMRQMHVVEETSYRRTNRHVAAQIVLTAEGVRQCAECMNSD